MKKTNKLTLCAIFVSFALSLSYMERFIPLQMLIPLPGIKLGLANVVTLMALCFLGEKNAFTILVVRVLMGSLFGGGVSGLIFSMTGGILAMAVMSMVCRMKIFSIYGVSVLGAAAHNIGQISAAAFLMGSVYIYGYLPYLLVAAIFTGLATGTVCAGVFRILASNNSIGGILK